MTHKEWYSPNAVTRFSRQQVKWLMPLMPLLRNGEYPPDPRESGYTDRGIRQRTFKPGAKWETAAGIAAEMDTRIQRAGADGLMMEFLYAFEPEDENFIIEHMAQALNLGRRDVAQRIRNALYYVAGADRKRTTYAKYVIDNHRRLKMK